MAYITGKGASVSTNLPGTMTPVPQVKSVNIPATDQEVEEVETINQTADYPEKIPKSVKFGNITVSVYYDPELHSVLDNAAHTLRSSKFQVQVGSYGTFNCVAISAKDVKIEKKGILTRDYEFQVESQQST